MGVCVLVGEGPGVMVEVSVGVSVAAGAADGTVVGVRLGTGESISEGTAVHIGMMENVPVKVMACVMVGGSYRRAEV